MVEIIPALMPKDFSELRNYARDFKGLVRGVQIDVMDGEFVPEISWPYTEQKQNFEQLVEAEGGLPFWDELDYEVDLMTARAESNFESWIQSGVKRIIVHYEALNDVELFFKNDIFNERKSEFLAVGIALGIDTPNEVLSPYMKHIDFVQCMGIARIGYQGQKFDERVLPKIKALRNTYPDLIISVDGGVSFDAAPQLVRAGANRLVSGSAILSSNDYGEAVAQLKETANS